MSDKTTEPDPTSPSTYSTSTVQGSDLTAFTPTRVLSPQEIRRIGAMQVENIQDETLDAFLAEQRLTYEHTAREELIETLLDRDRQLALEGRQLADGRIGGRLLREFVRGILHGLDSKDPQKIEQILTALGAEPADKRQLAKFGHTLGPGEDQIQQAADHFHGRDQKEHE